MTDEEKKENKERQRIVMPKKRRAFDWVCACLIRLPIMSIWKGVILAITLAIAYIISPDGVLSLLRMIGVRV